MEKCYEKLIFQKISFKNGYTGGASFCIVILLAACDNFLNAKETKSEIDAAIAYANASTYPIYIKYSGKNGVVKSPAGSEISKKVTDIFTLSFDPIGDYEFVSWKITNDTTNEELPNGEYLKIEDILNSETKCTFVKAPEPDMKLCLSPVVTERPQILSYAPMLGTEMSFKDSTIQVVFDYPMDINSIYYTDEELADLMAELGIANVNSSRLLSTKVNNEKKYYGYKDNDIAYFKNISISNNKTGESLTTYFGAPVFESADKLLIASYQYYKLPDYGEIKVEIGRDFYYTLNGKPITMAGNKKWIYQISDTRDNVGPKVVKERITVSDYDFSSLMIMKLQRNDEITKVQLKSLPFTKAKLNFDLRIRDESGIDDIGNVWLFVRKIYDKDKKSVTERGDSILLSNFQSINTYDGTLVYELDLTNKTYNNNSFQNGVYELQLKYCDAKSNFTFSPDSSLNTSLLNSDWGKSYVFVLDKDKSLYDYAWN